MAKTVRQVRRDAQRYYSPTSEALSYPLRNPRPMRRKQAAPVVRKGLYYRDAGQTQRPFSFCALVTLVLLFGVALSIVMSYALIAGRRSAIRGFAVELQQVQEENNLIRAQIAERYDIREVEHIAGTRLMMARPLPHQIVHIYVPR